MVLPKHDPFALPAPVLRRDSMRRLTIAAVLTAILSVTLSAAALADVTLLRKGSGRTLVLFIHGLWGHPIESFSAGGASKAWPLLMAEDGTTPPGFEPLSSFTYAAIGFPASVDANLSIEEIARRILTELEDFGVYRDYDRIHLIAHSMGGIVAKSIFVKLFLQHPRRLPAFQSLFLISTPTRGAPAANFISKLPQIVTGRIVADLTTVSTHLDALESNWRAVLKARSSAFPRIYCAYETEGIVGFTVVPKAYTDTLCDEDPRPEARNHINIVKPATQRDSIYQWVKGRIYSAAELQQKAIRETTASPPMPQKAAPSVASEAWAPLRRVAQSETVALQQQSVIVTVAVANTLWRFCEIQLQDKGGTRRVRFQRGKPLNVRVGDWTLQMMLTKVAFIPTVCFFDIVERK